LHAAELAARDAALTERDRQVADLADRVSQLERKAGRDSSTSGKPPSSDSPYTKARKKPRDRSLRTKTGRKPGKQPGTGSSTLEQVPDPDERVLCPPECCRGCGAGLAGAPVVGVNARQVFDPPPPPPRPRVTEYQVQARRCGGCGTVTEGTAPAGAAGRAQYGPRAHAHAADLVCGNHIPVARVARLMAVMSSRSTLPSSTTWLLESASGFTSTGFIRTSGRMPAASAWKYWAAAISPPSTTRALLDMLNALNGAVLTPRRAKDRASAVTRKLFPAQLEHPCTMSAATAESVLGAAAVRAGGQPGSPDL